MGDNSPEQVNPMRKCSICSSQRGNRITSWNETFWVNMRRTLVIWGQSSIGRGCPEGLGTLEGFWIYICRYFLDISIFLGKALNALAWAHSWTGFEMAAAVKAFWSPCQPEIFWFLEALFCPLQVRSHAQTAQRSLHLAALAESGIQSNPLSTSLVHWQGPVKGPANITPVWMLWTEAAHIITAAQHLETGCTKAGKKDQQGIGPESQHWAGSTAAALIPMEWADLTTGEGERVELGKELIHYIPAELEEKANSDFWGSAKILCPTLTHYFSGHYEEGAHWRTKKLRNLKAKSPYLCWTNMGQTLTNMASTSSASAPTLLSLVFTSIVSYFICIKVQKATLESSSCPQPLDRPILTGVKGQVWWDGVSRRQATVTAEFIENHKPQFTKWCFS